MQQSSYIRTDACSEPTSALRSAKLPAVGTLMRFGFTIFATWMCLITAPGCTGLGDAGGANATGPHRLNCRHTPLISLSDISTWEVYTSACEENPSCPSGFQPTTCSAVEYGCEGDTQACGNSYCEDGETKASCPLDCDVNRVPYTDTRNDTIHIDAMDRTYWLYEPDCYDGSTAIPLVIGLHGGSGTGEGFAQALGLNAKAESECFFAVYPNGAPKELVHGEKQYWNSGPRDSSDWWVGFTQYVDDVNYISQLIDHIDVALGKNIDADRIYATGFSNGGRMAYRLACELSDKIAAVAIFGAPLHFSPCTPSKNISILHIHGKEDQYNPYEGGESCTEEGDLDVPSVSETIDTWVQLNGCSSSTEHADYGEVSCETYEECDNASEVILCSVEYGGHTIAGGYVFPIEKLIGMGRSTTDIQAADFIWNFFSSHTLQ
jgi:polyhydroxybutyrate depolymerase